GTSQSFSFVNGQASSSITFNYVLVPRNEGTFLIEPIRFTVSNKQYNANPVTVTVVAAASGVTAPPAAATPDATPPGDLPGSDESIFVAASVSADTVYVNQQITWTLGYYTDGRVELLRSPNYSPPAAEGFWVEDLPPQNKYYANLHGRQYLVSEIKRGYFPTAPGVYTIGEARVDLVVDDVRSRGSVNDFFSRGLRGGFGQQRTLQTDPIQVVVLPLPGRGKPSGFEGAVVSNLTVSTAVDKQVVQVGEPVNVSVEMSGIGNMRTLIPPALDKLNEFKVYESGSSTDSFKKDYVVSGRRKFDFVLVPQAEGRFTIPPVSVAYFDPVKGSYAVAKSIPVPLEVKPGTPEDARKLVYAGGGDDFRVINRDIRFIHSPPANLTVASPPFYASRLFVVLQALPALAVAASLVIERRRRRLRSDLGLARASRALRDADRRIAGAAKAFGAGRRDDGFSLLQGAVLGYFADRMNVPQAAVTSSDIDAYLDKRGVDTEVAAAVGRVVAACNVARYAAGAAESVDGSALAAQARGALAAVEKVLR
ncbi:MAG: BatD family protein, partial [Candidatus Krumholzibacteria bacterium]|nr:BatD family protein [Candidatus Krumholzibacteria bacterium]